MTYQNQSSGDLQKALFLNLVSMLSMSAMQELGKLKNPFSGKTEIHLDMAQSMIDMLDMLEAKTRGNRDKDEERMLKDTLTMLKMNYVDSAAAAESQVSRPERDTPETGKQNDQGTGEPEDKKTAGQGDSNQSRKDQQSEDKPKANDPKFHKSYS